MFIYSILLKKWGYGNFRVTLGRSKGEVIAYNTMKISKLSILM